MDLCGRAASRARLVKLGRLDGRLKRFDQDNTSVIIQLPTVLVCTALARAVPGRDAERIALFAGCQPNVVINTGNSPTNNTVNAVVGLIIILVRRYASAAVVVLRLTRVGPAKFRPTDESTFRHASDRSRWF